MSITTRFFPLLAVLALTAAACAGPTETAGGQQDLPTAGAPDQSGPGVGQVATLVPFSPDAGGEVGPTGGTPFPDLDSAAAGDEGVTEPLGVIDTPPDTVRLDFLFEFCWEGCFRDAHFMDPNNPGVGSGNYPADTPFHIRHGFPNDTGTDLGDDFTVTIHITPMDIPGEFGGTATAQTITYTPDHTLIETTERCGPTYRTQTPPVTCQTYVHEFPDGLPEGRHAIWATWTAPCHWWADHDLTATCDDPNTPITAFTSGYDGPYDDTPPQYMEQDEGPTAP